MHGGIISPRMAHKIGAAYVCAVCWSPLQSIYHPDGEYAGQYTLECDFCGMDTPGFVTRKYAERRTIENFDEYEEAKAAMQITYPGLFPAPLPMVTYSPEILARMEAANKVTAPAEEEAQSVRRSSISAGPKHTESAYTQNGSSTVILKPWKSLMDIPEN
jgi:hypothetical protein